MSGYAKVYEKGHPLAITPNGHLFEHRVVLFAKIGPGSHACHWCSTEVHWAPIADERRLVVDHVDGDKGNNDPANLVPSCQGCNVRRGGRGIPEGELFILVGADQSQRVRAIERACRTCDKPFLSAAYRSANQGFYCSKPCYYESKRRRKVTAA